VDIDVASKLGSFCQTPSALLKRGGCGQWFDMRNTSQVLAHIHDAEIEIGRLQPRDGPLH
jgi:hypothetical protein